MTLARFARDRRGGIAILTALMLPVLGASIAAALDVTHIMDARVRIGEAGSLEPAAVTFRMWQSWQVETTPPYCGRSTPPIAKSLLSHSL